MCVCITTITHTRYTTTATRVYVRSPAFCDWGEMERCLTTYHLSRSLSLGCHLFVQTRIALVLRIYVYRMAYLPLFHMNVVQKVFCMFPEHCCQLTPIVRLVMHYWLLASATLTQRSLRICGEHTAARVCVFIRARKPRHCRFSVGEREAEVIAFLPAGHSPYEERALEGMAAMDETTPSSSCSCIVKSCNERLSLRA